MLEVTMLGCGGMMPLPARRLAACLLRCGGKSLLIDCGEGTQVAVRACAQTFKPIDAILVTHFHADHISGLPGFLLSMGNEGRTDPVTIVGPRGLMRVCESLRVVAPELMFEVRYAELDGAHASFEAAKMAVTAFRVQHAAPCYAYAVDIPRAGRFDAARAKALDIPVRYWNALQHSGRVEADGRVLTRDMVLGPPRAGIRFCYCTDTRPVPAVARFAQNSDLLICEGMYADEDKLPRAVETRHMIFREAGEIARDAHAKALWLTHFSPSLPDPEQHLDAARRVFPEAQAGFDGKCAVLTYPED